MFNFKVSVGKYLKTTAERLDPSTKFEKPKDKRYALKLEDYVPAAEIIAQHVPGHVDHNEHAKMLKALEEAIELREEAQRRHCFPIDQLKDVKDIFEETRGNGQLLLESPKHSSVARRLSLFNLFG
ncbi:hypothetical protein PG996_012926 [Apiospora saccharicola]|uniref:Uncharacterized protein n=1 Tax=Apiospora saccharicola TaxID=335842 RepID=A0ABR1U418_9PEZI